MKKSKRKQDPGTRNPSSDRSYPERKSPELETAVKQQVENAAKITGKDYR